MGDADDSARRRPAYRRGKRIFCGGRGSMRVKRHARCNGKDRNGCAPLAEAVMSCPMAEASRPSRYGDPAVCSGRKPAGSDRPRVCDHVRCEHIANMLFSRYCKPAADRLLSCTNRTQAVLQTFFRVVSGCLWLVLWRNIAFWVRSARTPAGHSARTVIGRHRRRLVPNAGIARSKFLLLRKPCGPCLARAA